MNATGAVARLAARRHAPRAAVTAPMAARRNTGSGVLSVLVGTLLACAASAEEAIRTPAQWLEAMDGAFRTLDYDGVFSYYTANHRQRIAVAQETQRPGQRTLRFGSGYYTAARLATFRIIHKVVDGVERERIIHLNGPPREILRTGDLVASILQPGDELLDLAGTALRSPHARVFARRFETAGDYYDVAFSGRDRVAARPTVRIDIAPLDAHRFGYRLWLDEQTGLLLRSELRDFRGTHLEIFQFTSLVVGAGVATADLEPADTGALVRQITEPLAPVAEAQSVAHGWRVRWLPDGFRLAEAASQSPLGVAGGVRTLMFTDGLAAFSIFIEAMPPTGAGSVVSRRGATVALTHRVPGRRGDQLVTVVGEVPVATARRVAAGVYEESL